MTLTVQRPRSPEDACLAAEIVQEAGRLLLDMRLQEEEGHVTRAELGPLGARWSELLILNRLRSRFHEMPILLPSTPLSPAATGARRVWLANPVDGVAAFAEPGRPDWGVQLALWEREHGVIAAAVTVPALCWTVTDAAPADLPEAPGRQTDARPRIVADPSALPLVAPAAALLDAEVVTMASTSARALAVARGEADAYVHLRGGGATVEAPAFAVATAAGLHLHRIPQAAPFGFGNGEGERQAVLISHPHMTRAVWEGFTTERETLAA